MAKTHKKVQARRKAKATAKARPKTKKAAVKAKAKTRKAAKKKAAAKKARRPQKFTFSHHREEDFELRASLLRGVPRSRHRTGDRRHGAGACHPHVAAVSARRGIDATLS